jgi:hypothetical protein
MEEYGIHPSAELRRVYKGYQGQDPALARFLFLGKDANFAKNIEEMEIFEEVSEYLTDGVGYWQDKANDVVPRHHPFLSPAYKGDGDKYHENFRKLELGPEYADKVSFIELLPWPTYGNTKGRRLKKLLNEDKGAHLRELVEKLSRPGEKTIYIPRGVYTDLRYDFGPRFGCFDWLPELRAFEIDEFKRNTLYDMKNHGDLKIYVITHFSDAISDDHISEIRATMKL